MKGYWVTIHRYSSQEKSNPSLAFLLIEFLSYLPWFGESSCFRLGIHQFLIYYDIKDTVAPGY